MYRRALVALDGSEVAETIMPLIFKIAGPLEVTLLRVNVPVRPLAVEGAGPAIFEDPESARIDAEEYLAPLAVDLRRRGVRVKTEVRRGEAAEEILKAAREGKADVIAMTTHGRTGLGRLLFGSFAETVLRESELPVLLMRWSEADVARLASSARATARSQAGPSMSRLRRILHATDFSPASRAGFARAMAMARAIERSSSSSTC
jgi:nucleotide-binding universal stress UspA family protein